MCDDLPKRLVDRQQFEHAAPSREPGLQTARAAVGAIDLFHALPRFPHRFELLLARLHRDFAERAQLSNQPLRDNQVQAGRDHIRFDAKIDQPKDRSDRVARVNGRKGRAEDPRAWPTGGAVRHVPGDRGALLPVIFVRPVPLPDHYRT